MKVFRKILGLKHTDELTNRLRRNKEIDEYTNIHEETKI